MLAAARPIGVFVNFGALHITAGVFWLLPVLFAALLALRFFMSRRQELMAGSLLLWRRLAARQPKIRPKRILIDRSLALQMLALSFFVAALSGPTWARHLESGRRVLLVIDNSIPSRAQLNDKTPLYKHIREAAGRVLAELEPQDRVELANVAPLGRLINSRGLSRAEAAAELESITPALSAVTPAQIISFAADKANSLGEGAPLPHIVISLQHAPEGVPESQWVCCAPAAPPLPNVAIVEFGALPVATAAGPRTQVLARLNNYTDKPVSGSVSCEILDTPNRSTLDIFNQPLALPPQGSEAAVFALPTTPSCPLRIRWKQADGQADALPEDDVILAVPKKQAVPRIRFHAPAPALEKLWRTALGAEVVNFDSTPDTNDMPIDLEVYVRALPENLPENSRALMLLAPESGYRGIFEVGPSLLENPLPQRDKENELTLGMSESAQSSFLPRKAVELRPTGDFESLVIDRTSGRALAASFIADKRRKGYVLAFVPGENFTAERKLEPALAALLTRMALQAAGSGPPFEVRRLADMERQRERAMPSNWAESRETDVSQGLGLLDENASRLELGKPANSATVIRNLPPVPHGEKFEIAAWLIAVGLLLCALELWSQRPRAAAGDGKGAARSTTART
jgi:hypothetical protein